MWDTLSLMTLVYILLLLAPSLPFYKNLEDAAPSSGESVGDNNDKEIRSSDHIQPPYTICQWWSRILSHSRNKLWLALVSSSSKFFDLWVYGSSGSELDLNLIVELELDLSWRSSKVVFFRVSQPPILFLCDFWWLKNSSIKWVFKETNKTYQCLFDIVRKLFGAI